MRRKLCVFLLLTLGISTYAQKVDVVKRDTIQKSKRMTRAAGSNAYEVSVPYYQCKSPEAAAFRKYGEYQVSEYTGSPNISVPLYTINYKDIQIPIVLTYDASGIKVEQEASWVGLGWNLMVGGCINYVAQGDVDPRQLVNTPEQWERFVSFGEGVTVASVVDEDSIYRYYFITYGPDKLYYDPYVIPGISRPSTGDIFFHLNENLLIDLYRGYGETDYFSVSFLGHSFLFVYDRYTNQYRIIGKSSDVYQIEDVNHCSYQNIDNAKWRITDGHGTQYFFIKGEQTTGKGYQGTYTSTWLLESIVTSEGTKVSFGYSGACRTPVGVTPYEMMTFDVSQWRTGGISYPESGYYSVPTSTNSVSTKYLSSITTPYETISFVLGNRDDITLGKRLDKIVVKSTIANDTIREYKLNYTYFTSSTVGGDLLTNKRGSASYTDKLGKRLKLVSVDETGGKVTLRTSFEYNNSQLPLKTSAAQDFWGYFNNQENYVNGRLTLLPTPKYIMSDNYLYMSDPVRQYKGANRYCDGTYMQAAILQKIIYPTKGYTKFVYEPHQFISDQKYPTATVMANPSYSNINYSLEDFGWDMDLGDDYDPHNYERMTLNQNTSGSIEINFYGDLLALRGNNAYVRIAPVSPTTGTTTYYTLSGEPTSSLTNKSSYVMTRSLSLNAGTYDITVFCPNIGSGNYLTASINLKNGAAINSIPYSTGGGLRIKRIENYDNNNALLDSVGYYYTNEQGRSTGMLLQPLRFLEKKEMVVVFNEGSASDRFQILSIKSRQSAMPAFAAAISGGVVGYSSVTKKVFDARGNNLSTIASTYRNSEPEDFWGRYFYYREADNGELLSQVVKGADGNTLKMTQNTYDSSVSTFGHILLKELTRIDVDPTGQSAYPYRYYFYHFPFRYTWHKLTKTTTTTYDGSKTQVSTTSYVYNSTNHQVKKETSNSSEGISYVTEYKYPCDFPSTSPYNQMCNSTYFMQYPVIEQSLSAIDGGQTKLVRKRRDNYSTYTNKYRDTNSNGKVFLPSSTSFSLSGGSLESRLSYVYNDKCDRISITKDNTEKVTYLWAYNYMYPVAEIKGATYSDLTSWGLTSSINSLATKTTTADVSSLLATIRSSLASRPVLMTSYTYDPSVGITGMTAPNGTKSTYTYDTFGRLSTVKNHNGTTVQSYSYNYKNN